MTVYCVFWVENSQFLDKIFMRYEDALEYACEDGSGRWQQWNIETWDVE